MLVQFLCKTDDFLDYSRQPYSVLGTKRESHSLGSLNNCSEPTNEKEKLKIKTKERIQKLKHTFAFDGIASNSGRHIFVSIFLGNSLKLQANLISGSKIALMGKYFITSYCKGC